MTKTKKENQSIEQSLSKLENILEELENGELELDQALQKFEEGIKLSRQCQKTLEEAEMKIKILMDNELKDTNQSLDQ
ncbi:MAG: exodeoxyribonuclease VII small subunit [Gammaproteobacteria bacterium]|mgnify:FL=1|jgi:exodeoxyribonuclease VII small subunit|nr:exodeoxyribonuclease VII small subunit [Gammaproteobacteria bacterium]|tara:strand:+ start:260 stop:493 length:234 start_codon:yes stop_codon:yes gene_type:complete